MNFIESVYLDTCIGQVLSTVITIEEHTKIRKDLNIPQVEYSSCYELSGGGDLNDESRDRVINLFKSKLTEIIKKLDNL